MDAVGQNALWDLEYTRLRSYEIEITEYQWVNVQGGTKSDFDWMDRDLNGKIS